MGLQYKLDGAVRPLSLPLEKIKKTPKIHIYIFFLWIHDYNFSVVCSGLQNDLNLYAKSIEKEVGCYFHHGAGRNKAIVFTTRGHQLQSCAANYLEREKEMQDRRLEK